MPDLIITLGGASLDESPMRWLKSLYPGISKKGMERSEPWGRACALEDVVGGVENRVDVGTITVAWVGDLTFCGGNEQLRLCVERLERTVDSAVSCIDWIKESGIPEGVNGAFSMVVLSPVFAAIITDPTNCVPSYACLDAAGRIVAAGTQQDTVAAARGRRTNIDSVSVTEFLVYGTPTFPHTMYSDVVELNPGTIYPLNERGGTCAARDAWQYWIPPRQDEGVTDGRGYRVEFERLWRQAVERRLGGGRIGIELSGGMDSRLIMAVIPEATECIGLTLCDRINREAELAKSVATCYRRRWEPLIRQPEYVAETMAKVTRLLGCEGDWIHAHAAGFDRYIESLGFTSVFSGLFMDCNFKGNFARDFRARKRLGGILPSVFERIDLDYVEESKSKIPPGVKLELVEASLVRRRKFCDSHVARDRTSRFEWLDAYPYSQSCDNGGWTVERRLMPLRVPVVDRDLLDLAFRIPFEIKAGGRFFDSAVVPILGPGSRIPNSSSGVRPGSGHLSRGLQRTRRIVGDKAARLMAKFGRKLEIQHSWHDLPRMWRESERFREYRTVHRDFASGVIGKTFDRGVEVGEVWDRVGWQMGMRLLQMASWSSNLTTPGFV